MSTVIDVRDVTRKYKKEKALDNVSIEFEENVIYGLLGRNGAGKTTLMSTITAQNFPTSGSVRVFGQPVFENDAVLSRMCFVREGQKYPDDATPNHAFAMAELFFPNWSQEFAERLTAEFDLPLDRRIKKLSRGQLSAVGVVIGLASRAEVTFFDEPYLGLDAVARQTFYDNLLADWAENPRTVVLSSHLIDEIAHLIERVVLIDRGRILLDEAADDLRGTAFTLTGNRRSMEEFAGDAYKVLHRETLGNTARVSYRGTLTPNVRDKARELGLEVGEVSLQQLMVRLSQANTTDSQPRTDSPRKVNR